MFIIPSKWALVRSKPIRWDCYYIRNYANSQLSHERIKNRSTLINLTGRMINFGIRPKKNFIHNICLQNREEEICQATVKWRFRSKAKCPGGGAKYQGGGRGGILQVYCQEHLPRQNPTKCCSYGGVFFVHQVKLGRPGNYVDLLVMAERFIERFLILMLFVETPTL